MAGVMPLQVPFDGWTVLDLPDDRSLHRYELVDGVASRDPVRLDEPGPAALRLAALLD